MELNFVKFFDASDAVKKASAVATMKLAARVTAQAKTLAPVDFGQLRNSIMYRVPSGEGGFNESGGAPASKKIDSRPRADEGYVGVNLDYAIYQEFGTRKMKSQPYLRPAIAIVIYQRGPRDVKEDIDKEVASFARSGRVERVKFY